MGRGGGAWRRLLGASLWLWVSRYWLRGLSVDDVERGGFIRLRRTALESLKRSILSKGLY